LTTLPEDEGGVEHVFYWNPGVDVLTPDSSVRLRVQVSDGGQQQSLITPLGTPLFNDPEDTGVFVPVSTPSPTFSSFVVTESALSMTGCTDLVAFDRDATNNDQLAVLCGGEVEVYSLQDSGWIADGSPIALAASGTSIVAGDFDGDSDEDVAVVVEQPGPEFSVALLENQSGTLLPPVSVAVSSAVSDLVPVNWRDTNEQRDLVGLVGGDITLFEMSAFPSSDPVTLRVLASPPNPQALATGRWDGPDGPSDVDDLIVSLEPFDDSFGSSDIYLFRNDGTGGVIAPEALGMRGNSVNFFARVFVADIQGDDRLDVIGLDLSTARVQIGVQTELGLEVSGFDLNSPLAARSLESLDGVRNEVFVLQPDGAVSRATVELAENGIQVTSATSIGHEPCQGSGGEQGLTIALSGDDTVLDTFDFDAEARLVWIDDCA
ncbi:MAG: hypothetical protein AAFY60_17185, partial [Myxococcota bacterium]